MLAFGERCNLRQVGVRRLQGKVLPEVVRSDLGVHEAVLDLHRDVVLVMHDQRVKDPLAFAHVQRQGTLGASGFLLEDHDLAGMAMAACGDLVGNVMHFEQRRLALGLGDKGADALHAHQQTFGGQLAQCPVYGHAAEAQLRHQFAFRRHTVVRRPGAILDLQGDHLFHAGVQGCGTFAHLGCQGRSGGRSRHVGVLVVRGGVFESIQTRQSAHANH